MINTDYILNTWVPLLRSGKYKQCRVHLIDDEGRRCAIGYLLPDGMTKQALDYSLDGIRAQLGCSPITLQVTIDDVTDFVVSQNDRGASLPQIADALEAFALAEQADQLVREHRNVPVIA